MATENRLWGAERIRGELLRLGYTAAKSTIQRYMRRIRGIASDGKRWYDRKFGAPFDAVAEVGGTRVIRTPILAPQANGHVERLIGTLRRECTDHVLIRGEAHLQRVLDEYRTFFNEARPHQGIGQRRPVAFDLSGRPPAPAKGASIVSRSVLGGLHHDYRLAS
jgi:hypothetical protein